MLVVLPVIVFFWWLTLGGAVHDRDIRVIWSKTSDPNQYEHYDAAGHCWRKIVLPATEFTVRSATSDGKNVVWTPTKPGGPLDVNAYTKQELSALEVPKFMTGTADGMIAVEKQDGIWSVWTPALLRAVLEKQEIHIEQQK